MAGLRVAEEAPLGFLRVAVTRWLLELELVVVAGFVVWLDLRVAVTVVVRLTAVFFVEGLLTWLDLVLALDLELLLVLELELEGLLTWLEDLEPELRVALVERLLDEVLRLLDLVLVWVEVPRLLV